MPVRVVETSAPSQISGANPEDTSPPACTLLSVGQVVTFWEGEIVDTKNYTFFTGKWEATSEVDIRHWTKFPSFSPLLSQVEVDGGKSLDLSNYPYIFMRWKEQYFVNVGTDCGLTIAGFYYVCFSCSDGSINGFYYDPNSSPFQKLELKSTNEGRSGFCFSSYELQ
ncbi:uncharacterized protein LOC130794621 isoform X2 [Actinidia eriantha]|uniref:uncharacterized protein LOC130794621 isoform X2 n=1 Tax=Actinidia eriantha TaxID=165200 RepID=UPI002585E532|nr:uncharacterized protein LOC130794621 isoform X2 [Actinidia eriantha]